MPLWKENTNEPSHSPSAVGWRRAGWGIGEVNELIPHPTTMDGYLRLCHPETSCPHPCPS